jgi:hypothetical protein
MYCEKSFEIPSKTLAELAKGKCLLKKKT